MAGLTSNTASNLLLLMQKILLLFRIYVSRGLYTTTKPREVDKLGYYSLFFSCEVDTYVPSIIDHGVNIVQNVGKSVKQEKQITFRSLAPQNMYLKGGSKNQGAQSYGKRNGF